MYQKIHQTSRLLVDDTQCHSEGPNPASGLSGHCYDQHCFPGGGRENLRFSVGMSGGVVGILKHGVAPPIKGQGATFRKLEE